MLSATVATAAGVGHTVDQLACTTLILWLDSWTSSECGFCLLAATRLARYFRQHDRHGLWAFLRFASRASLALEVFSPFTRLHVWRRYRTGALSGDSALLQTTGLPIKPFTHHIVSSQ